MDAGEQKESNYRAFCSGRRCVRRETPQRVVFVRPSPRPWTRSSGVECAPLRTVSAAYWQPPPGRGRRATASAAPGGRWWRDTGCPTTVLTAPVADDDDDVQSDKVDNETEQHRRRASGDETSPASSLPRDGSSQSINRNRFRRDYPVLPCFCTR